MHVIYLHGFASSPQSKKANYFRPYFEQLGIGYSIPDLNQPSFAELTLTAILATVDATVASLASDEIVLIGSSLGGLSAVHYYDRYRQSSARKVSNMVLLAPALDFMANRDRQLGEDWQATWREQGFATFFNYATNSQERVDYGLIDDIEQYDSDQVILDVPVLIYHGKHDESVDSQQSVVFARTRDNVTLHVLDSDHQLLDQTDHIRDGIMSFLNLKHDSGTVLE